MTQVQNNGQALQQRLTQRAEGVHRRCGTYNPYVRAQEAVVYLANHQFQLRLLSIVCNGPKKLEHAMARLSYPHVALAGTLTGMWLGFLVGMPRSFFYSNGGLVSIVASSLTGADLFMLIRVVSYALQRRIRDFTPLARCSPPATTSSLVRRWPGKHATCFIGYQ